MTFDTFAKMLRKRLTNLGYKTKTDYFGDKFYLKNYYNSTHLFNIESNEYIQYAESPDCMCWTTIKEYSFPNLKELYVLAKQYSIDSKEKKIKDKLNEINKDFQ